MKSSASLVRRFGINELGRDFAVGDIHGEFSLVLEALELAGFDGRADRLFCVGDLIDRGSECHKVLEFLTTPGIFSIKGNHEDDLVGVAKSSKAGVPKLLEIACREIGVMWWHELDEGLRGEIVEEFAALPLAFEVKTHQGVVGIVHAEPVPSLSWSYFVELLEQGEELAVESALRGREVAEGREEGCYGDVWRVFAGHTPAPGGMESFGNLLCIDTGAVFGKHGAGNKGHLTLARIDAPDFELRKERSMSGLIEIKGCKVLGQDMPMDKASMGLG